MEVQELLKSWKRMDKKQLEDVKFDFIRYANCWEDADILLEGLNPQPHGRYLSIGSAGDNSFSLLTKSPEFVVAVDISKVQLYLVELKKLAIEKFSHKEFLEFLGFSVSDNRLKLFDLIKYELNPETKDYWEYNSRQIEAGLIYEGKFEKYFLFFSKRVVPLIHNQRRIAELFRAKSEEEQTEFYQEKWNSWRWRMLFKVFFSKRVMGNFGRDPAFLREVKVPVSEYIFQKAEKHLSSTYAQQNYFLRFIHTGNFGDKLPHYVREENYLTIKKNIGKLHIFEGLAEKAMKEFPNINYMNLSNIFEYMDEGLFKIVVEDLLDNTASNARFAYWNLMVPRKFVDIFPDRVNYEEELSMALMSKDKGFFYKQVVVDQKL